MYVVATPIGNLEDLSPRARRILGEVSLVAAEDTRTTRQLLNHCGLKTRLVSFHEHTSPDRRRALVDALASGDIALVSEAGTPGVSDPGTALVADALAAGFPVVPIPGPSAVAAALSASGLPADRYLFMGFLPRRSSERRTALAEVVHLQLTLVAYETPRRLAASLADLVEVLGAERIVVVGRELTKHFEEIWRGRLGDAAAHWAAVAPRGEFTLVIEGAGERTEEAVWEDQRIQSAFAELREAGVGAREASRRVAALAGRPAREVYALGLKRPDEPN